MSIRSPRRRSPAQVRRTDPEALIAAAVSAALVLPALLLGLHGLAGYPARETFAGPVTFAVLSVAGLGGLAVLLLRGGQRGNGWSSLAAAVLVVPQMLAGVGFDGWPFFIGR